jgi:hypothetical protein
VWWLLVRLVIAATARDCFHNFLAQNPLQTTTIIQSNTSVKVSLLGNNDKSEGKKTVFYSK